MSARIGFGCASLGSRVSAKAGTRALMRAFDAGVTWFDVAPSYGDGAAETILGAALAGRRDHVTLCTKVGILPPAPSLARRLAKPLLRTALSLAPQLRQHVRRHRPAAVKPPLVASAIEPGIEASLRRLGTDHVDVLALHDAAVEEVVRDDVLRALERVVTAGKARRISIASSVPAVLAGIAASDIFSVAQVANNVSQRDFDALLPRLPACREITTVTHTVFGADGLIDRTADTVRNTPDLAAILNEAGYDGDALQQARSFLSDFAFASNERGVVLLSMFSAGHLEANLVRLSQAPDRDVVLTIADRISEIGNLFSS